MARRPRQRVDTPYGRLGATSGRARRLRPTLPQGAWVDGRMHGEGAFVDAEGRRWVGHFFEGSGPGLTFQLG
jgi:hypothetical protein